jgi:DNA-binding response OmpR family regulator
LPAVLFVSATVPAKELRDRGLKHLPKPFDLKELHRRVAALLGD